MEIKLADIKVAVSVPVPRRDARRATFERPSSNVIDLLVHRARERDNLHRRLHQILPGDWRFRRAAPW